jgi:flagellar biosynthesis/type III secretory pathway protein FliH
MHSSRARVIKPDVAGNTALAWAPADLSAPPAPANATPAADPVGDAFALGFASGRLVGEQAERARLRSTLRAAEEALEAINAADARWTGAAEENLVALATAMARHIIERELAVDSSIVRKLVGRALAEFPIDQPLRLRVHPDDLANIEALGMLDDADDALHAERLAWVGDARVSRGGCVVEGRERILDGRIEPALERIYRRLTRNHA